MPIDALAHRTRRAGGIPISLVRAAAVAATVLLLAASVPVVWAAVSAGLGLLALAVLAIGGTALFQALPWVLQRMENRLLRLRRAEARANPTEQLHNEVLRRSERLTTFRSALATIGGQIETITQMLAERRHLDPGHVLERQQRALQRLVQFHGANLQRLDLAQAALQAFREQVRHKVVEWEVSLAIEIAGEAIHPGDAGHLMQDLLTDEALRAVQDRFNTAFADLDIQMRAMDSPARDMLAETGPARPDALLRAGLSPHGRLA